MKITLKASISAVIGFLAPSLIAVGMSGMYGMNKANQALKTVYEDRTVALEQVSRIDSLLVQNRLALAQALLDPIASNIKTKSALIEKNADEINKAWAEYIATESTPEERLISSKFERGPDKNGQRRFVSRSRCIA